MTTSVAFVVLAHADPPKVRRLLGALDGADVFLHCDRRTPATVLEAMIPPGMQGVFEVDRLAPKLSSWSLVEAELRCVRAALERSAAEHIVIMSGACYPLVSVDELAAELADWRGRSRFELNPIPYQGWSTKRHPDGGMWRFTRRFLTVNNNVLTVRDVPLSIGNHTVPASLQLYGSSHWKIYSRRHAEALLRVFVEHPEQLAYWRHTYVPEETCVASVLKSPELVGELASSVENDHPWFIEWRAPTHHPVSLGLEDFDEIAAAQGKLFARKIGSQDADLLDRIDRELRHSERDSDATPRHV